MRLYMVTAVAANNFGWFQFNQMELECFVFMWAHWTHHMDIQKNILFFRFANWIDLFENQFLIIRQLEKSQ